MGNDMTRDRDTAVEQLLRQSLRARPGSAGPGSAEGAITADCLDAEALAAWVDGAWPPNQASSAESHVASCVRCQDMLAVLARTMPVTSPQSWWRRGQTLRWLVPLTAGATAAVLWFAIPPTERPVMPERQQVQAPASSSVDVALPGNQPSAPAPAQQQLRARANQTLTRPPTAENKDLAASRMSAEKREARDEASSLKQEAASSERLDALREAPRAAFSSQPPAAPGVGGVIAGGARLAA